MHLNYIHKIVFIANVPNKERKNDKKEHVHVNSFSSILLSYNLTYDVNPKDESKYKVIAVSLAF